MIRPALLACSVFAILVFLPVSPGKCHAAEGDGVDISLPGPRHTGGLSVEDALHRRRSARLFRRESLSMDEVSQLLWAAQGITSPKGFRTAPSAGALYPLEVYLLAGNVEDIPAGVYKYRPQEHRLVKVRDGDLRAELSSAALRQPWVKDGAVVIVFSAVYERTTGKYGRRGRRYVHMETGHAAQNVYLQAESLGLGTVMVGAFDDKRVKKLLGLEPGEEPLGIMPVGKAR